MTTCPSCDSEIIIDKSPMPSFDDRLTPYLLGRCKACDLVLQRPLPSEDVLNKAYQIDYYGASSSKFMWLVETWAKWMARRRAKAIVRWHHNGPQALDILDVGCGRGVLLHSFLAQGHRAHGLEREDSPFGDSPHVTNGDINSLQYGRNSVDIVVLWHVLEHLREPGDYLRQIRDLLKLGGSLVLAVPNEGSIQSRWFGKYWFHLDLPRHLYHFNPLSLETLLSVSGFTLEQSKTFTFDQNLFGFVQSCLNGIPFLPNNHLFKVLKAGPRIRNLIWIVAYGAILPPLVLLGLVELYCSNKLIRGASLIVLARKKK